MLVLLVQGKCQQLLVGSHCSHQASPNDISATYYLAGVNLGGSAGRCVWGGQLPTLAAPRRRPASRAPLVPRSATKRARSQICG